MANNNKEQRKLKALINLPVLKQWKFDGRILHKGPLGSETFLQQSPFFFQIYCNMHKIQLGFNSSVVFSKLSFADSTQKECTTDMIHSSRGSG